MHIFTATKVETLPAAKRRVRPSSRSSALPVVAGKSGREREFPEGRWARAWRVVSPPAELVSCTYVHGS